MRSHASDASHATKEENSATWRTTHHPLCYSPATTQLANRRRQTQPPGGAACGSPTWLHGTHLAKGVRHECFFQILLEFKPGRRHMLVSLETCFHFGAQPEVPGVVVTAQTQQWVTAGV